jgi:Domain of unknown function (DUF4288)
MWYTANLLYRSIRTPTESKPTVWEESVRLIQARNEAEARQEAEVIGRAEAHSYEVEDGAVAWVFERIERLFAITDEELRSGSEVFSRYLRDSEVKSLLTPFEE